MFGGEGKREWRWWFEHGFVDRNETGETHDVDGLEKWLIGR